MNRCTRRQFVRGASGLLIPAAGLALPRSVRAGPILMSGGRGVAVPEPGDEPFYEDDFESFADGANLTGTDMGWSPNNGGSIKVSDDFAYSGSKSVNLPFNSGLSTIELDYDLGADYSEVTFQYYVRWPADFHHSDSTSSDNNKFFRVHSRSDLTNTLGCSMELAARGDTQYADLASEWDIGTDSLSFTARSGLDGGPAIACQDFITPDDLGTWVKYKWRVKAATAKGSGRAVLQVWKNDVLVIDERPDTYVEGAPQSFGSGYLWGARNTDDSDTDSVIAYMDNVTVWAAV